MAGIGRYAVKLENGVKLVIAAEDKDEALQLANQHLFRSVKYDDVVLEWYLED